MGVDKVEHSFLASLATNIKRFILPLQVKFIKGNIRCEKSYCGCAVDDESDVGAWPDGINMALCTSS